MASTTAVEAATQAPPSVSPLGDRLPPDSHTLSPNFPLYMALSPPKSTAAASPPLASPSGDRLPPDSHTLPPDFPFPMASSPPKPDCPHLASQGSAGTKSSLLRGIFGGSLNQQRSTSSKPAGGSLSSSPDSAQSLLKGKKDAITKHSGVTDFRDWCESESVRLIGTKDTSFLEFCAKQSRSEAEMLLIENLGVFDPDHKFIDKFLNYKESLPADVLKIAFQRQSGRKATGFGAGDTNSEFGGVGDSEQGGSDARVPEGS